MAKFPTMPLWTDAYIAATDHLTFEEHGVYLRLLILMWRTPGCRIPNDQAWIERRLRVDNDTYENLVWPVIVEFLDTTGNYLTSNRLQREYEYVLEKAQKQSVRSKSRWNKEKHLLGGNADPAYAGTSNDLHKNDVPFSGVSDKALKTNKTQASGGNAPIPIPNIKKESTSYSPKKKPHGTRLPDDWQPDDNQYTFAVDHIGASKTHVEIAKFKDHYASTPGAKGRKVNWNATWRNWIRRHGQFNPDANGNRSGTASLTAAVSAAIAGGTGRQGFQPDGICPDQQDPGSRPEPRSGSAQSKLVAYAEGHDPQRTDHAQSQNQNEERGTERTDADADSLCG
jgi:uncharacterized protein YdaU (DUF1376 family)